MDADEKLTALKKAYADVILSTSKEAAARVLSSERKSARWQHELAAAKEDGVRMLMRLKKMMDSQMSEAEAASLAKQKKIEELEAQLEEAEDIVSDLRQELGQAHAELDRVKNENLRRANERIFHPPNGSSDVYVDNRYLPNIISRGKDRNGFTHRIRACERKVLEADVAKDASKAPPPADMKIGRFQSFLIKKKRAARRRRTIVPLIAISTEGNSPSDENPLKDEASIEKTMPREISNEASESLCSPDYKMESIKEICDEPPRERAFKYTFQRKRKRQALSEIEATASLEEEEEEKTGNAKNGDQNLEQSNPSLLTESSRESRRLAQVARQLISLSEKKWWH
ncbi:hypothetical protein ACP275_04G167600 [Erythranthe tilingii]